MSFGPCVECGDRVFYPEDRPPSFPLYCGWCLKQMLEFATLPQDNGRVNEVK